jgi:hypothetical protein
MSVPPTIRSLIAEARGLSLPGILAEAELVCQGARFHSPRPLVVREYVVRGGKVIPVDTTESPEDSVWLCGTCASNVEVMTSLLVAYNGSLSWQARREFGNDVRAIAERGWIKEQTA